MLEEVYMIHDRIWDRYEWYLKGTGELHRLDGPAVEYLHSNKKEWYQYGKHHRSDGPALIYESGNARWYINGKRHRDDGPAFVSSNGNPIRWFINDRDVTVDVGNWMYENTITYPFSEEHLVLFRLRFL